MKRMLTVAVLLLMVGAARAQKVYFVYIQAEGNTPFFVKMGDKVTSSTASGYLILSKLVDSTYQFSVGKTGDAAAESRFSVTINKKDRGFLLKESDGKLGLFDLQALTLLPPLASAAAPGEAVGKRTDAFSILLAQAANDPSLLEIRTIAPVVTAQAETRKTEPEPAVAITTKEPEPETAAPESSNTDTITQTTTDTETTAAIVAESNSTDNKEVHTDTAQLAVTTETAPVETIPVEEAQTYKRSIITRKSESSTSEGFGLTFLDEAEGRIDTIRIVIPNQSTALRKEESEDGDLKKFLDITDADTTQTAVTVDAANEKIRAAETKKRKGCAAAATEREFFKLRKNMAAEESDAGMIKEAQKAFRKSCFSTEQIKNLSSLFLTAGGKYHFFDAAYGHVSDQEQYAGLQSLLNDDYYVNRFKVLIAKQ